MMVKLSSLYQERNTELVYMERGLARIGRRMHKQARIEEHWKVKCIERYSNCVRGDLKVTAATYAHGRGSAADR
jgi:hypothetical protein